MKDATDKEVLRNIATTILKKKYFNNCYLSFLQKICTTDSNCDADALFVWVPKTAGTSLYDILQKNGGKKIYKLSQFHKFANKGLATFGHMNVLDLLDINVIKQDYFSKSFKFTIVRNPWDRAVSLYFHLKKIGGLSEHVSFTDFCEILGNNDIEPIGLYDMKGLSLCRPQTDWITDKNGNIIVDYIGRFENLVEEFEYIKNHLGITGHLPHKNATSHNSYKQYYNEKTKKIIEQVYFKDIELLGYKF